MPIFAFSQINLKVLDEDGKPVSEATVSYNNQDFTTDDKGFVKIPLAESDQLLSVQKPSFRGFNKNIKIKIDGNFEEKMYKVSRIERNGKISILGKGDLNEKEFESIEFEIFQ